MQQDAAEHFGTGLNLGRLCFRAELKPRPRRECAHRHPQSRVPQLVHRECPLPRHAIGCCIGLVKPCKLGGFRRGAGGQGQNWPAMIEAANRLKGLRMKAELSTSPTEPCPSPRRQCGHPHHQMPQYHSAVLGPHNARSPCVADCSFAKAPANCGDLQAEAHNMRTLG